MNKDHYSTNTLQLSLRLRQTPDANRLNYSSLDEFRTDTNALIKTIITKNERLEFIGYMNNSISQFFNNYEDLKLSLYKIHFLQMIISGCPLEQIEDFYLKNIKPIICNKNDYEQINYCLLKIKDNPEYVQTRTYQGIWFDFYFLFPIAIQEAIHDLYTPNEPMPYDVISREDYQTYLKNKKKIDIIEMDIINTFAYKEDIHMTENLNDDFPKKSLLLQTDDKVLFEEKTDMNMIIDDDISSHSQSVQSSINNNLNSLAHYYDNDSSISQSQSQRVSIQITGSNTNPIPIMQPKSNTRHSQPSIHKEKKKELKVFQFKFSKRENIDKKILRSFKKVIKKRYKAHDEEVCGIIDKNQFWKNFLQTDYFPRFTSPEGITFSSFNTAYMLWIFGHDNVKELYNIYLKHYKDIIYRDFIVKNSLSENNSELPILKNYINSLAIVFSDPLPKTSNATKATSDYIFEEPSTEKHDNDNIFISQLFNLQDDYTHYGHFSLTNPMASDKLMDLESVVIQDNDLYYNINNNNSFNNSQDFMLNFNNQGKMDYDG